MSDKPFLRPHFPKGWTYEQAYDLLIALEKHVGNFVHMGVVIPTDAPDPHYEFITFNENKTTAEQKQEYWEAIREAEYEQPIVALAFLSDRMTFHNLSF